MGYNLKRKNDKRERDRERQRQTQRELSRVWDSRRFLSGGCSSPDKSLIFKAEVANLKYCHYTILFRFWTNYGKLSSYGEKKRIERLKRRGKRQMEKLEMKGKMKMVWRVGKIRVNRQERNMNKTNEKKKKKKKKRKSRNERGKKTLILK